MCIVFIMAWKMSVKGRLRPIVYQHYGKGMSNLFTFTIFICRLYSFHMLQNVKPVLLLMIILMACQSPWMQAHHLEERKKIHAGLAPPAPPDTLVAAKKAIVLHLTKRSVMHLMSAVRQSKDTASNGEAVPACKTWNLSETDILTILKNGTAMTSHDLHYLYEVLPCEVDGVVEVDSSRYNYSINAGSFFLLYDEDSTYYFECRQAACKKFFLVTGGDPGEAFDEH